MKRREFLQGGGTLLSIGLLPPLGTTATGGVARLPGSVEIESWVDEMEQRLARAQTRPLEPLVGQHLASRGLPTELFDELNRTTLLAAALQDLPPGASEHPAIRPVLAREAPRGLHAALQIRAAVLSFQPEELRVLGQRLRTDRRLGRRLRRALLARGEALGLPRAHTLQGARILEITARRMAREDPDELIRRELRTFDALCLAADLDPEVLPPHVPLPSPQADDLDPRDVQPGTSREQADTERAVQAWKKVLKAGGYTSASGGGFLVTSGLMAALGSEFTWLFLFCGGFGLLGIGVVLLLVGAIGLSAVRSRNPGE